MTWSDLRVSVTRLHGPVVLVDQAAEHLPAVHWRPVEPAGDVDSRETLLAEANSEAARQQAELFRSFMELCDTEDAAPSAGLRVHTEKVVSEPDGNNGILLDLHDNRGAIGYGIEAFTGRNPLAWPSFATEKDVQGFPPTIISVNECDPLRDEGINFYRLLLRAGVPARCRQVMGTMHGTEIFTIACPEISRDTARDLAAFGKN